MTKSKRLAGARDLNLGVASHRTRSSIRAEGEMFWKTLGCIKV
ncbi:MAG TPA: hypothetical protein VE133_01995 [Candidatus Sulfotelmatobacter sp.]|nr:hypothetical protein [Candidatus Sulfotelmatobacter sp.]